MKRDDSRRFGRIRPSDSRWDSRPRLSSRAKPGSILSVLCEMASVSRAVLQEIFDESSYQRFLDRTRLTSSPKAYAIFQKENEQAKSGRPRCF